MPHDHHQHHQGQLQPGPGLRREAGRSRQLLWWALLINLVFLVVEFIGGLLSGSLALLADAGHMLTDVAALGIAIGAAALAEVPPTPRRTFGLVRAEVLGAFINGASLVVVVGFISWESWRRLQDPQPVAAGLMLLVSSLGLAANLASALILMGRRRENLNIQGAFLHMVGDALGSLGAIIAAAVIYYTGWYPADTVVSLVIGAIILWSSLDLLRRTLNIIINATPEDISFEEVRRELLAIEHFAEIHDLHIWSLASGFPVLSAHASLRPGCADSDHVALCLGRARKMLREKFGITHSTLQLEPPGYEKDERVL